MSAWKDIGTLLLEYGLITYSDLQEGIVHQKETGLRLGETLAKLGRITMEDIDYVLSKQLDIPFVIVENINVNPNLLSKFDKKFLIQHRVLPLHESDDQISIAIEDPFNRIAIETVSENVKKQVNVSTGNGKKIEDLLRVSFEKVGTPELVASIKDTIEKIRDTSFYRIDLILDANKCTINVFGAGIKKGLMKVRGNFNKDDVFKSFDSLDISFLYDIASSEDSLFLAIYPLTNRITLTGSRVITGCFGLYLPEDISFTDSNAYRISHIFHSKAPPKGYAFIATKADLPGHNMIINTVDSMPENSAECYVNVYIPNVCTSCNGQGCSSCRDLGYEFNKMEGMYSVNELKKRMKEKYHG